MPASQGNQGVAFVAQTAIGEQRQKARALRQRMGSHGTTAWRERQRGIQRLLRALRETSGQQVVEVGCIPSSNPG